MKGAVVAGRFDQARRLADAAGALAKAGGDAAQAKEATALAGDVAEMQEAYEAAGTGPIKRTPRRLGRRLAAGKYQCFALGNWAEGLPRLAAGSDPALAALAKKETAATAASPEPAEQSALADDRWNYAETLAGLARRQVRLHAAGWYKLAQPKLAGRIWPRPSCGRRRPKPLTPPAAWSARLELVAPPAGGGGGEHAAGGLKLVNTAGAAEGQKIIDAVLKDYPDLLKGVKQVELVRSTTAANSTDTPAGRARRPALSRPSPVAGRSNGIMLWGIYEKWPAGKYVVVYRIQCLNKVEGGNVCFCDVCKNGGTMAQRRPAASELHAPDAWHEVAFPMELTEATTIEFRLWPNDHEIAIDRVYLYRLPEPAGAGEGR